MHVLALVGSLRADSFSRRLAAAALDLTGDDVTTAMFGGLADLPAYDQDADGAETPAPVAALREAIGEADALLLVTPEYNGSVPGFLKNAIDWASRPRGAAALAGLPVAVVGASPSPRGAQWAAQDAARILGVAGASVVGNPVTVPEVHRVLDDPAAHGDVTAALSSLLAEVSSAPVAA